MVVLHVLAHYSRNLHLPVVPLCSGGSSTAKMAEFGSLEFGCMEVCRLIELATAKLRKCSK